MRLAVAAAAFAVFLASQAHAATIAVPENVGPWGLNEALPSGERGIFADLAEALARHGTNAVTLRFVPYGRMLAGIRSGEFDYAFGVVGPATTDAGPFIAIIGQVPMIAIARQGLALRTLDDLHRFNQIGYLRGGSCGAAIDEDPQIHRVSQDSYETAIRKMAAGRLDGWCSVKAGFDYTLRSIQPAAQLGDELEYGDVKIGFQASHAKADTAEAKDLAAELARLVAEGAVGKIFMHYLGSPYPP